MMRLLFGVSLKTAVKNFSKNKILKNKSRTRNVQDLTSLSKVVATTYDTSSFQKSVLYDPHTLIEIHFLVWDGGKIMRKKWHFLQSYLRPRTKKSISISVFGSYKTLFWKEQMSDVVATTFEREVRSCTFRVLDSFFEIQF